MKTSIIMNLISVLMDNDKILLALISVSALIFIVCALMAIILLMILMMNYSNSQLVKNPLNKDTIAYQMRDACNINLTKISSNYPYGVIIWLLFLNIIVIGFAVYRIFNGDDKERVANNKKLFGNNSTTAILVVILFAVFSLLMFGLCYLFFNKTKHTINNANKNVTKFNELVTKSMYTKTDILNNLQVLPTNTVDIINNIENTLKLYFDNNKTNRSNEFVKDLSQIFFTFNLYQHYVEMGVNQNNSVVSDALISVFSTKNIFKYSIADAKLNPKQKATKDSSTKDSSTKDSSNSDESNPSIFTDVDSSSWPAADYLINKYTFIKDYSNTYIQLIHDSSYYTDSLKKKLTPQVLLQASNIAAQRSILASQYANSFNLNASLNSFITMAVWIAIITILPFVLIWFILSGTSEGSIELLVQKELDTNAEKTIAKSSTRLYEIDAHLKSLGRRIERINGTQAIDNSKQTGGNNNEVNKILKDKFSTFQENDKLKKEKLDEKRIYADTSVQKRLEIQDNGDSNTENKKEDVFLNDVKELESIAKELLDITQELVGNTKRLVNSVMENNIQEIQELNKKNPDSSNIELKINIKKRKNINLNIKLTESALKHISNIFKSIVDICKTIKGKATENIENIIQYDKDNTELNHVFTDIKISYNEEVKAPPQTPNSTDKTSKPAVHEPALSTSAKPEPAAPATPAAPETPTQATPEQATPETPTQATPAQEPSTEPAHAKPEESTKSAEPAQESVESVVSTESEEKK